MRVEASIVERAIRLALEEHGLGADPIATVSPSGWPTGDDPGLSEDRDASSFSWLTVQLSAPDGLPGPASVYVLLPGPDGKVEVADADQNVRALRLGKVADAAWEHVAAEVGVTVEALLAFDETEG